MGIEFFGSLLGFAFQAIFVLYWVATIAILWGLWRARWSTPVKAVALLTAAGFLVGWPAQHWYERRQVEKAAELRYQTALALFEERCKTAGEKITRTVEGVEGVLLLKLRPKDYSPYKQNATDPYGVDFDGSSPNGEAYISSFLWGRDVRGFLIEKIPATKPGYRYVDITDPGDGKRYRYTAYMGIPPEDVGLRPDPIFLLKRQEATGPAPRYGVTYDDITTPEERAVWIAGGSLKVVDTRTNEVIAERIGYMMDKNLGSKAAGRQPWSHAQHKPGWSCPPHQGSGHTRQFVEQTLKVKED